jgi:nicotinate-nucleotide adenylyltransferase
MPEHLLGLVNFLVLSRPGCRFADLYSSPYLSVRKEILRKLDIRTMLSYLIKLRNENTVTLLNISPVHISATDIRARIRQGKSIKYLLPEQVESYIISKKLYAHGPKKNKASKRKCI